MPKVSAGILPFRFVSGRLEAMLVHPGGPIWAKRDEGAWSIPKGLVDEGEDLLAAALREFEEETGLEPDGDLIQLDPVRYSGKILYAWALAADLDLAGFKSNTFSMEWPPGSGLIAEFPEADRACWFGIEMAKRKILKGQLPLLDQLQKLASQGR
ncbi:MAG: NUDIX domain-containing protein [Sedimentisphaerales bacterium]|nr:NUDIX domain-containing protein [Sedimentisphaerales bacterium]